MPSATASPAEHRRARAMARKVVEHHLGSKARRVVEMGGGLTNFVFEVRHPQGDFIVRLSQEPSKIRDYLKEQWAIGRARDVGVPAPEVLEVGCEVIEAPYMIARKTSGRVATHHPEELKVVHEMGSYAAFVHTIPTSGFGPTFDWSSNQLSRNETWTDYLHKNLRIDERIEILAAHRMLLKPQIKALRSLLRDLENHDGPPVLNHGDLRLKNVLVDPAGGIAAIIDWENCTSNIAPFWDLSLALHDLSIDAKQAFLAGYGMSEDAVRETGPILKALNVLNYAPYVRDVADRKDTGHLDRFRTRLSGALDLYSL